MPLWVAEANRLRSELPPEVQRTLAAHEAAGTTSDPAYAEAAEVFYRRHVCRVDPWPDCFVRTAEALEGGYVYNLMNGPSEFHCVGKLKDWDITARLPEIAVPTLLLSGRYDEATPTIVESIHERIPRSEWIVFEHSSHTPHLEEPEAYNAVVRAFLAGVEARPYP
jgi:proline-specific peptidase